MIFALALFLYNLQFVKMMELIFSTVLSMYFNFPKCLNLKKNRFSRMFCRKFKISSYTELEYILFFQSTKIKWKFYMEENWHIKPLIYCWFDKNKNQVWIFQEGLKNLWTTILSWQIISEE